MQSGAPEAVWQVLRPPCQSKIWYGDAIPIKSKAVNLFIIYLQGQIYKNLRIGTLYLLNGLMYFDFKTHVFCTKVTLDKSVRF